MCSICNNWSHLSCYSLSDAHVPDLFLCLYCQFRIVTAAKRKVVASMRTMREDFTALVEVLRPIAEFCDRMLGDPMNRINGPADRRRIAVTLGAFRGEVARAWQRMKDSYDEIQKMLNSVAFERKPDEMYENEEWPDEAPPADDQAVAAASPRQGDYEEDEGEYSTNDRGDDSSSA
jgi:hypothetical protein